MGRIDARFIGAELCFSDLDGAKEFYHGVLGLQISEEQTGHPAKFDGGGYLVPGTQRSRILAVAGQSGSIFSSAGP